MYIGPEISRHNHKTVLDVCNYIIMYIYASPHLFKKKKKKFSKKMHQNTHHGTLCKQVHQILNVNKFRIFSPRLKFAQVDICPFMDTMYLSLAARTFAPESFCMILLSFLLNFVRISMYLYQIYFYKSGYNI